MIARLVAVALLAGVLVACSGGSSSGPRASAGTVLADDPAATVPYVQTVQLPWGALSIKAGKAADRPADSHIESTNFHTTYDKIAPPPGGSWVFLSLNGTPGNSAVQRMGTAAIPTTSVTLINGKQSLQVHGMFTSSADTLPLFTSGFYALPWKPTDLHMRITYDGVSQDVYLASNRLVKGAAAGVYGGVRERGVLTFCGKGTVPGYRVTIAVKGACSLYTLNETPYVIGLGWTRPGRHWLVATISTYPPDELRATTGVMGGYLSLRYPTDAWTSALAYGSISAKASFSQSGANTDAGSQDPRKFAFDLPATDDGTSSQFTLTVRFTAMPDSGGRDLTLVSTRSFSVTK